MLLLAMTMLALIATILRADSGDMDSARDYPGFPPVPGFVITDFDEDNPAEFDFPVARPLPTDSNHVELNHVRGHRYVIRYEASGGARMPTVFQTQRYYEKLAAAAGYTVVKDGSVGAVTETFHRASADHEVWIFLEPAVSANVLTVVEGSQSAASPPTPPRLAATSTPPTVPLPTPAPTLSVVVKSPTLPPPPIAPSPALTPPPSPPAAAVDPNDDSLYESLSKEGRVILPFVFQPGKDELDASSQPLIERVATMLKRHNDIFLRIEGHTDNSGDSEDNMRLSAQRAIAIQNQLIHSNIDRKRLDAVGVGGLQPLADNNTAEGREKNRRIELVLWKRNPAFHEAAPNGQNYYPNTPDSSSPSRAGL